MDLLPNKEVSMHFYSVFPFRGKKPGIRALLIGAVQAATYAEANAQVRQLLASSRKTKDGEKVRLVYFRDRARTETADAWTIAVRKEAKAKAKAKAKTKSKKPKKAKTSEKKAA